MSHRAKAKRWLVAAILLSTCSLITGCGKSDPEQPPVTGSNPQPMPPGYGNGGCVPITQAQIPFTGSGVRVDSANIVAGQVPGVGQVGTMAIGGAPTGGPYQRQDIKGMISMNVMVNGQVAQPGLGGAAQSTGNLQGFVQLSQQSIQDILYLVQIGQIPIGVTPTTTTQPTYPTYPGYPTYPTYPGTGTGTINPQQVCVSQIAINSGVKANIPGYLYASNVYLYLNNTQHGYNLYLSLPAGGI